MPFPSEGTCVPHTKGTGSSFVISPNTKRRLVYDSAIQYCTKGLPVLYDERRLASFKHRSQLCKHRSGRLIRNANS
jgi:hypothetical protein